MVQTINPEELKMHLEQFTGTDHYYEHKTIGTHNLLLTDGSHYLREEAKCYWLMDLLCSYQYKLHKESFQVWTLKNMGSKGWDIIAEDGNKNQLASQRISYSDFPIEEGITLFLSEGVIMLPSEY